MISIACVDYEYTSSFYAYICNSNCLKAAYINSCNTCVPTFFFKEIKKSNFFLKTHDTFFADLFV